MNRSTILVTGGTFGLGRAMCLGLVERGHQVIATGVDAEQVSSTARGSVTEFREYVAEAGLPIQVIEADATDSAAIDRTIQEVIGRFGRIDAVVNNAAIGPLGTLLDTSEELFARVMAVNLMGPFIMSRAVVPHFIEAGGGSIINIGSGAGWGKPNMVAYSASKGGLAALTSSIAYDYFHHRIRANLVIPGGGGMSGGQTMGRFGENYEEARKAAVGSVAGRPVNGDDLAGVVDFLAGPAGAAISGTVIDVGCFAHQGGPIKRRESDG